ncbi:MAG: hypothetical protein JWP03_2758 [Phycisphaerales bacterium]|nr:hypothetical protein [Phycisphaerales bacterium]
MATVEAGVAFQTRDALALFKKLGLEVADPRPIMEGWAEANAAWLRERSWRVDDHSDRVLSHLHRFGGRAKSAPPGRKQSGRKRPVWCVELKLRFRSLTDAARFVERSPSNILQALNRGLRCGPYHWEPFDQRRHRADAA